MEAFGLDILEQVPLAPYATLGLGGPARYLVECTDEPQIAAALREVARSHLPVVILGGGSNVVFPDEGFPGFVIRIATRGILFRDSPTPEIVAEAGAIWDDLVRGAVERGWAGVECLSGIPGTVGGTPIQNVGAYGQEVAAVISSVTCLDRSTLVRRRFSREECGFGYRTSRFKTADRGRYVVLEVAFRLRRDGLATLEYPELRAAVGSAGPLEGGAPAAMLRLVRDTVLALRRRKSMVLDPSDPNARSAGSFFMNPVLSPSAFDELRGRWSRSGRTEPVPAYPADGGVKVPAAWLIEQAGFRKGYRHGGVGISTHHALALVNYDGTTAELLALADSIRRAVAERFGVELVPEPEIVQPNPPAAAS